jgi:hypothetical protein
LRSVRPSDITNFKTEYHIIDGGQGVKEAEGLKYEADFLLANHRSIRFTQTVDRDAVHERGPFVGR